MSYAIAVEGRAGRARATRPKDPDTSGRRSVLTSAPVSSVFTSRARQELQARRRAQSGWERRDERVDVDVPVPAPVLPRSVRPHARFAPARGGGRTVHVHAAAEAARPDQQRESRASERHGVAPRLSVFASESATASMS